MSQIARTGRIVLGAVLALGVASFAGAQSPQSGPNARQSREKRHSNQVPDTGGSPEQDAAPATGAFDRVVENVVVRVGADGMRAAELDDSFMEAVTVSQGTDGSLAFSHFTGLATAARAVSASAATPRTLTSRPLPALFPILEEKE
jgi:hypothetical protein